MEAKILLVEDDPHIAQAVKKLLEKEGFTVVHTDRGSVGESMAISFYFDLIVLDVMLPDTNGFSVCRRMREKGVTTPILMLTVKSEVEDKVTGLESGADDYLTKPFSGKELIARIKALIRRARGYKGTVRIGELEVDMLSRRVKLSGKEVELSPKEYELLELLVRNRGRVLGERFIIEKIWGHADKGILKVYMHHLRQKLDKEKKLIKTIRGVGYTLDAS